MKNKPVFGLRRKFIEQLERTLNCKYARKTKCQMNHNVHLAFHDIKIHPHPLSLKGPVSSNFYFQYKGMLFHCFTC